MTVVLEDQVKIITAEIAEQFGGITQLDQISPHFDGSVEIEDVVRAVIAQYDISPIARLEPQGNLWPGGLWPGRDGPVINWDIPTLGWLCSQ